MKNFLVALLVFLVWSVIGLWIYSIGNQLDIGKNEQAPIISKIPNTIIEPVIETLSITPEITHLEPAETKSNFLIKSLEDKTLFESDETFAFQKDSQLVTIPEELTEVPSILASYLNEHPGQELHITSYYSASAKLQTPNIGEQRGENFKTLVIDEGIDTNRIVVKPAITTAAFEDDETLNNAMTFSFKLLDKERIANAKSAIPESITFYPSYDFDELLANSSLQELADEVVELHKQHPELMIEVIGHTDHIGASSENYVRGLKSARQIRWYLVIKGEIDRKDIIAISKGESEPILRDGRPASRKENARVEIQFSEKE